MEKSPIIERNLTEKTAQQVRALCRARLAANPNSRFVREQYPQTYAEIIAEQQTETTHQGKEHAT
jgi:hypothetical protein